MGSGKNNLDYGRSTIRYYDAHFVYPGHPGRKIVFETSEGM